MSRFSSLEDIVWRTVGGRLVDNVPAEMNQEQHKKILRYLSDTLASELQERVVDQQRSNLRQLLCEMAQDPAGHLVSRAATGTAQINIVEYPDVSRLYRELLLELVERLGEEPPRV